MLKPVLWFSSLNSVSTKQPGGFVFLNRFEDGVKRLHQDRDVIMDKLVKALEMVFKYDQHISNSLEQVEQFSFTSLEQLR